MYGRLSDELYENKLKALMQREQETKRRGELENNYQPGITFFENVKESYSRETIYNALRDGILEQTNFNNNLNTDAIHSYLPPGIDNYLKDRRVYISIRSIKYFISTYLPDREKNNSDNEEKVRQSQLDKAACQALARHLWNENPNVSIIDLIRHSSIQKYGNASQYNEKTIRKWLSEVDPRPPEQKTGRPKRA
jgi:hypothetical protein